MFSQCTCEDIKFEHELKIDLKTDSAALVKRERERDCVVIIILLDTLQGKFYPAKIT